MADSAAFDFVCRELEQGSSLDRLEARGTVRLALKQAGLEARTVTPHQLAVVAEKILPDELTSRGIESPGVLCQRIASGVARVSADASLDTADAIFQRLGS